MRVKQAYDNFDQDSIDTGLACLDASLAQQSFKEEVDILTIVSRFGLDGKMPQVIDLPEAADYEGIFDYQTAMNALVKTRETFDALPYKIRDRFNNNPEKFYNFVINPENEEEIYRLGLAQKPAPAVKPEPMEVRVVGAPDAHKTP